MGRRRNTVHDLAALRLHPDGSRVHATDRQSRYITNDSRGNVIAVDAGGSATVKKRRHAEQMDEISEGREDIDINPEDEAPSDSPDSVNPQTKGKDKRNGKYLKNTRARKRKTFIYDLDSTNNVECRTVDLPIPSSELLKSIHRFAADYYTEQGQLLDATRSARQEMKKRKLERQGKSTESGTKETDVEDPETEAGSTDSDASSTDEFQFEGSAKHKGNQLPETQPVRDMYKLLDGSALVALAMLFQEHVAEKLQPNMAPGWGKSLDDTLQEVEDGRLVLRARKPKVEAEVLHQIS